MRAQGLWFQDRGLIARSKQVARVLAHHGLGALSEPLGTRRFWPGWRRRKDRSIPGSVRLRLALEELGVTFIKLGQTLSTRADLLPENVIAELSKLQDAAPPFDEGRVVEVVACELGGPPEQRFAMFDLTPIASASIGQVHAARLHDGTPVAVKVRRPEVMEQVERDLGILDRLGRWVQSHTSFGRDYDVMPLVSEFSYTLRNEMDYVREGKNAERLRLAFQDDPSVWIPRVHWQYTTERVLTLDLVSGIKVTDDEALDRLGVPRRTVAENAVRMFLHEVLELGFFHADPHPGNFFVQPDGSIAVVDFGMVGRLSEPLREHLLRAGLAAMEQDAEGLCDELFALGIAGRNADRSAFRRDLEHLLGQYDGRSIRELSAEALTRELSALAFRHRLQLPGELALFLRVISMSEGIGLSLDPEFRYFEYASPILRAHWQKRHSPRGALQRLGRAAVEATDLGLEMPRRLGRLIARLERGELELNMRHEGLDRLAHEFDRMTNRLALALVLAASVVALAVALGVHGMEGIERYIEWLFGLGFVFSLGFGFWLLASIWRSRRH